MRVILLLFIALFFNTAISNEYDYGYTKIEPYRQFVRDFERCSLQESGYEKYCENTRFNIEILKTMCESKDANACLELSEIYSPIINKTEFADEAKMVRYANLACELDPSITRCRGGGFKVLFSIRNAENKKIATQYKEIAMKLLTKSCELGDSDSCEALKIVPIRIN